MGEASKKLCCASELRFSVTVCQLITITRERGMRALILLADMFVLSVFCAVEMFPFKYVDPMFSSCDTNYMCMCELLHN